MTTAALHPYAVTADVDSRPRGGRRRRGDASTAASTTVSYIPRRRAAATRGALVDAVDAARFVASRCNAMWDVMGILTHREIAAIALDEARANLARKARKAPLARRLRESTRAELDALLAESNELEACAAVLARVHVEGLIQAV